MKQFLLSTKYSVLFEGKYNQKFQKLHFTWFEPDFTEHTMEIEFKGNTMENKLIFFSLRTLSNTSVQIDYVVSKFSFLYLFFKVSF